MFATMFKKMFLPFSATPNELLRRCQTVENGTLASCNTCQASTHDLCWGMGVWRLGAYISELHCECLTANYGKNKQIVLTERERRE